MTVVESLAELDGLVGTHLGTSDWRLIEQDRIDGFAAATDDAQWIHTDPERARSGPFGTAIAHGYLTLALIVPMSNEVLDVHGVSSKVNYGLGKVRFPAPVPVGSRVRGSFTLASLDQVTGGVQLTLDAVVECEGAAKPVCVAQPVFRYLA